MYKLLLQKCFQISGLLIILAAFMLSGCASKRTSNLPKSQIPAFNYTGLGSDINSIRLMALKDAATSLGAQGGLAWRSQQIDNMLERNDTYLSQIFNFRALLLKDNVLPPVLSEGENNLNIDSDTAIRLADQVYKIESPPRFVSAPPTWRDYLWMNYAKPDQPDATLLPKNREERAIWNTYITKGWNEGIQQANQIYAVNVGRLKRDYQGMILYRVLLAQNMVTAPFVAKTNLGVTGNATEMRVNDEVLRITATSQLQPNPKVWKPVLRPDK